MSTVLLLRNLTSLVCKRDKVVILCPLAKLPWQWMARAFFGKKAVHRSKEIMGRQVFSNIQLQLPTKPSAPTFKSLALDCSLLLKRKWIYSCFWFPYCFLYSVKLMLPGVKGMRGSKALPLSLQAQQRRAVVLLPRGGAAHELRVILSDRAPAAPVKINLSTPRLNASLKQLAGQLLCFFSCLGCTLMCIWSWIQQLLSWTTDCQGQLCCLQKAHKQNFTVYWLVSKGSAVEIAQRKASVGALASDAIQTYSERLSQVQNLCSLVLTTLCNIVLRSSFRKPLLLWNLVFFQHTHVNVNSAKWASGRKCWFLRSSRMKQLAFSVSAGKFASLNMNIIFSSKLSRLWSKGREKKKLQQTWTCGFQGKKKCYN